MDTYFTAIVNYRDNNYPLLDLNIFAPPMDQEWYSISLDLAVCEPRTLTDGLMGYDYMASTYYYNYDGYNWHNYWLRGKENYASCAQGGNIVSYYFPWWMKESISQKGGHITEADLASYPWQMRGLNPLQSKKGPYANAESAAISLGECFAAEPNASNVIVWLLNGNTGNEEHDWHEAYDDDGFEWLWFRTWWLDADYSP